MHNQLLYGEELRTRTAQIQANFAHLDDAALDKRLRALEQIKRITIYSASFATYQHLSLAIDIANAMIVERTIFTDREWSDPASTQDDVKAAASALDVESPDPLLKALASGDPVSNQTNATAVI